MDSDQTNFKGLWPQEQKLLGALRLAMRMWWLCLLAALNAVVWGEGHWGSMGVLNHYWDLLCVQWARGALPVACRGDPCSCGSQDKHVLEACWKLAGCCAFQGLSFSWRSLQGEQRPASHHTWHSLGPRAVRIAPWGLGMPGVCPSWQWRLCRLVCCCHLSGELRGLCTLPRTCWHSSLRQRSSGKSTDVLVMSPVIWWVIPLPSSHFWCENFNKWKWRIHFYNISKSCFSFLVWRWWLGLLPLLPIIFLWMKHWDPYSTHSPLCTFADLSKWIFPDIC